MTYRKKRLILIQSLLLFSAVLLLYFFYYKSEVNEQPKEVVKIENKKLDNLSNTNYFENVEYKGIDANGNRYILE